MNMDDNQLTKYFGWLERGKTPSDIKQDLLRQGLSEIDAHKLMVRIDSLFLDGKLLPKEVEASEPKDGRIYRVAGWIVVGLSILISIFSFLYASAFGGWFIFISGGGGGFGLIRYGHKIESRNLFKRDTGFRRRFNR
jgi:hypothetical protein